jgi:hypothetical protein
MILEDLRVKYATFEMPPYGPCLVVPIEEFDPDWEEELGHQGLRCVNTVLDDYPVVLVLLRKAGSVEGESNVSIGCAVKIVKARLLYSGYFCLSIPREVEKAFGISKDTKFLVRQATWADGLKRIVYDVLS